MLLPSRTVSPTPSRLFPPPLTTHPLYKLTCCSCCETNMLCSNVRMYTDRFQTRPLLPPLPLKVRKTPPRAPPPTGGEHPDFSGDLKIPVKTQEFWPKMAENRCSPCSPPDRFKRRGVLVKRGGVPPLRGGSVHPYLTRTMYPSCPST